MGLVPETIMPDVDDLELPSDVVFVEFDHTEEEADPLRLDCASTQLLVSEYFEAGFCADPVAKPW